MQVTDIQGVDVKHQYNFTALWRYFCTTEYTNISQNKSTFALKTFSVNYFLNHKIE